jgi:hypothetical protein
MESKVGLPDELWSSARSCGIRCSPVVTDWQDREGNEHSLQI